MDLLDLGGREYEVKEQVLRSDYQIKRRKKMTDENQKKETVETQEPEMQGAFFDSLRRNAKQIKTDRALAIAEDAQIIFRRTVEDLEADLKKLRRTRENMLDMSPNSAISLQLAENFDSRGFVSQDIELGVDIRNTEIRLEIAKTRYEYLFGPLK